MEKKGSSISSSTTTTTTRRRKNIIEAQECCYKEWMNLQSKRRYELKEIMEERNEKNVEENDVKLEEIGKKIMEGFKEYAGKRRDLGRKYSCNYYAPSWNSSLENALIWMGGCRPSSFFRLVYALCGSQTEIRVSQFLNNIHPHPHPYQLPSGNHSGGGMSLSDLTAEQLAKINVLHVKIIEEEEKLTKKVSSLQEDAADMPIAVVAYSEEQIGKPNTAVDQALDKQEEAMASLLAEADKLRVDTLSKIVEILSPIQAADFLLAGKKLHLSMHEWGSLRERRRLEYIDAGEPSSNEATVTKISTTN